MLDVKFATFVASLQARVSVVADEIYLKLKYEKNWQLYNVSLTYSLP